MVLEDTSIQMGMFMKDNGKTIKKMGLEHFIYIIRDRHIKGISKEELKKVKEAILGVMVISLLGVLKME